MYYEENKPNPALIQVKKAKKQKQTILLIALVLIGGLAYYFFGYLPEERQRAKEEIEQMFRDNWNVLPEKLDKILWAEADNWEEYLESLFLPSQVKAFKEKMLKAIERKAEELEQEELDKPRKMREEAIDNVKKSLEKAEEQSPDIQKIIERFSEKINNTSVNDLSSVIEKTSNLILEKRYKRKRLYWLLPPRNWADRWLKRNSQSLDGIWNDTNKMMQGESSYFDAKGAYRIQFPPSLWNELTEEQKELAKSNGHGELTLRDEVHGYKFSPLIEEWENKVKPNPVRGEMDPNDLSNLDNNALFYGAPRTGKSVMAEKLAYEADIYPLVAVQGSSLTPSKPQKDNGVDPLIKFIFTISSITYDLTDDYGFERAEDGETRYILFLDEADQACTTNSLPPSQASTELTFLKECMGSDNKSEESKNLWIAATNHLDSINMAIYQAGRLSNPLSFSWTLGEFIKYANDANISGQFPQHWMENKTLKDEDNQWVNRFNKIIFDKDFLPFWNKFINNDKTQEKLNEVKETDEQGEEVIKQKGIQWGEFFEFFWRLYDSKQLENFEGEFINPRKTEIEEILTGVEKNIISSANQISKTIDARLNELKQKTEEIRFEIGDGQANTATEIRNSLGEISTMLAQISSGMGSQRRNRSPW